MQGTGISIAVIGIALGYFSTIALEGFFILLIGTSLYLAGGSWSNSLNLDIEPRRSDTLGFTLSASI